MTVEQADVVDHVALMPDQIVMLTIADHLPWEPFEAHHAALLAKINSYAAFVDSGQLLEEFPKSAGREIVIRVFCDYRPSVNAIAFLDRLGPRLAAHKIRIEYGPVYGEGYKDDAA